MSSPRKIKAGVLAVVGFAWLFWLAFRTTVEAQTYPRLSAIPVFANCPGVEDFGPVKTLHYMGPHDHHETGFLFVAGDWPGEGFERFAAANELIIDLFQDEGRRETWESLPPEFTGGVVFTSADTWAVGPIGDGRASLYGTHSKSSGRFVMRLQLRVSSAKRDADGP